MKRIETEAERLEQIQCRRGGTPDMKGKCQCDCCVAYRKLKSNDGLGRAWWWSRSGPYVIEGDGR